jgi:hypothetical protein
MVHTTQNHWVCGFYPSSGIQIFSSYLEFRTMDKVHKPSNSEKNVLNYHYLLKENYVICSKVLYYNIRNIIME